MFATRACTVAKGGRPKNAAGRASTKHVRINDDLAEKLSWVLQVLGPEWTSARLLDPHIRGPITAMYAQHESAINGLKKAQAKARESRDLKGKPGT